MTEDKRRNTTVSPTTVTQTETVDTGLNALTAEEERVLRMRYGLSEGDDHELKFGLGANDDAVLKLAMMEQALIEMFKNDGTKTVDFNDTDFAVKSRIINALKGE